MSSAGSTGLGGEFRGLLVPSKVPDAVTSYPRSIHAAPYTALAGVVVDGRQPDRHPVTPRCRVRRQVGFTNRWRLPESLGSDLLGTAQARKSLCRDKVDRAQLGGSLNGQFGHMWLWAYVILKQICGLAAHLERGIPTTGDDLSQTAEPGDAVVASTELEGPVTSAQNKLPPLKTRGRMPVTEKHVADPAVFLYHSEHSRTKCGPDVLLRCLSSSWELHRPFLQKSETLAGLLAAARVPSPKAYYRSTAAGILDKHVDGTNVYSNDTGDRVKPLGLELPDAKSTDPESPGVDHPKHTGREMTGSLSVIQLDIQDTLVTKQAMAVALGHLYQRSAPIPAQDVVGVLGAAHVLKYHPLTARCVGIMTKTISCDTVVAYHRAAAKMTTNIQLRHISADLLLKILKSHRLFTYSEFALYKMVAIWTYLLLNPDVQIIPTFAVVREYFNSLPKVSCVLDREMGAVLAPLYVTLRLHGALEADEIRDIQTMNILPQSWVVSLLGEHYHALQRGGDMACTTNFSRAIRQGFILDNQPDYHSEVLSLHGFNFELKAVRERPGTYSFYMQHLGLSDAVLAFRQREQRVFSARSEREVLYSIRVQWPARCTDSGVYCTDRGVQCLPKCTDTGRRHTEAYSLYDTGVQYQVFGTSNSSRSQVLTLTQLSGPVHVTFSVLFPPTTTDGTQQTTYPLHN